MTETAARSLIMDLTNPRDLTSYLRAYSLVIAALLRVTVSAPLTIDLTQPAEDPI